MNPKKFKIILQQEHLRELLQQIRGQQVSITLLLQTYQNDSLTEVKQSIQDYNIILQQMANKGLSLWRGNQSPGQQHTPPAAIVGNGDTDSVFELSSIITGTRFDFDYQVLDSRAYRSTMMYLKHTQQLKEAGATNDEYEQRGKQPAERDDSQGEGFECNRVISSTKSLLFTEIDHRVGGRGSPNI